MMMAAQLDEAEPSKPRKWIGHSTKVAKDPNNKKEAAQGPDFTVMALWLYILCQRKSTAATHDQNDEDDENEMLFISMLP